MQGLRMSKGTELEPWLSGMAGKGRHRQFFDVGGLAEGKPVRRVDNFLSAYRAAYNLRESDVKVLFGAHGDGLGFVLSDRLWNRFRLGELFKINDPSTNAPALRNVFDVRGTASAPLSPEQAISGLMRRGVRMLGCMNSVASLASRLAADGMGSEAALRSDIVGGFLPGVMPVPAMLIAGNRAQETGFTYAWLA